MLREKFPGTLTKAESFIHFDSKKLKGGANYGTYLTIIHSVANFSEFRKQQKQVAKDNKLAYIGERLSHKNGGFSESEGKWFLPFKGADPSVVRRTQVHESSTFGATPLQYGAYLTLNSFIQMVGVLLFAINIFLFTRFSFGIKLLERFPSFFSFGAFSKRSQLNQDEITNDSFSIVFHGQGYSGDDMTGKPDRRMRMKFSGPNAGYIFTTSALIAAAWTLLDDKLRNRGGVLTPGSAFQGSGLVERLLKRGVKIECEEE